jgi:hypothetical protein
LQYFSSPEKPICFNNIHNHLNQNNVENGILRKRRNLKPLHKVISIFLANSVISLHKNLDTGEDNVIENGSFSLNASYVAERSVDDTIMDTGGAMSKAMEDSNHKRRRVIEQFDLATGGVLRRYRCMVDACADLGLPGHYLSYKVFGGGARLHNCVFGWRESQGKSITPKDGENYGNVNALKAYMKRYLGLDVRAVPSWTAFLEQYTAEEGDQNDSASAIVVASQSKRKKAKTHRGNGHTSGDAGRSSASAGAADAPTVCALQSIPSASAASAASACSKKREADFAVRNLEARFAPNYDEESSTEEEVEVPISMTKKRDTLKNIRQT